MTLFIIGTISTRCVCLSSIFVSHVIKLHCLKSEKFPPLQYDHFEFPGVVPRTFVGNTPVLFARCKVSLYSILYMCTGSI